MTKKNLFLLTGCAVLLAGVAAWVSHDKRPRSAQLNGAPLMANMDLSRVTAIEIGSKLKLEAQSDGWKITSHAGYPADKSKIVANLLKLKEQTVGQVVRGRATAGTLVPVRLKESDTTVAEVQLGDVHMKKIAGMPDAFGGYPDGRYAELNGQIVLLKDPLSAFDSQPANWCETKIISIPANLILKAEYTQGGNTVCLERSTNGVWTVEGLKADEELNPGQTYALDGALANLNLVSLANPSLSDAETGFDQGYIYKVTVKDGDQTFTHTARIGKQVPDETAYYFRLDDRPWLYMIPQYAAESLMKTRDDLVRQKEKQAKPASEEETAQSS